MIRNSWGTHWGLDGFMKIIRGTNNMAIEADCAYAVPKDTWTNQWLHQTTQEEKDDPNNNKTNGVYGETKEFLKPAEKACFVRNEEDRKVERRPEVMSWDSIDVE